MKTLTKAEEDVMQYLWKVEKGFIKDILVCYPNPKPAYNTVSTIVRILETKGFIAHTAYGKTYEYYPLISKEEYSKQTAENLLSNYFEGSLSKMISFFVKEKKLNTNELDQILKDMNKQK